MRHFSKKNQPVFKLELIQKISKAVYFLPVKVLFAKILWEKLKVKWDMLKKTEKTDLSTTNRIS